MGSFKHEYQKTNTLHIIEIIYIFAFAELFRDLILFYEFLRY
jgi:hypothetical protein